jgi:NAD(P)-dependent dehydrogenase (short-subunit alcohol dehydrogenase family)
MAPYWHGKVAIVTGAATGIGAALGRALVDRGATVVLTDVDEEGVGEQAERSGAASAVPLDVTDRERFASVVADTVGEHGHIDLLCNIAGIGIGGDVTELSAEAWDRVIDVNIRGTVHGIEAAYPRMVDQGHGHLANMASLAGLGPLPLLTPYAMTKHAIVGLSTSLRFEAAEHGVRVSAICPAAVETRLLDSKGPPDLQSTTTFDARRYLTDIMGAPYPADRLAADVLEGLEKNRALIIAPAKARLFWRLGRFLPGLVAREGVKAMRKERAAMGLTA